MFTSADFMRERLSDLSDTAVDKLYHAIEEGSWMEVGRIIDKECGDEVRSHYQENMIREVDEVDKRLDEEAA